MADDNINIKEDSNNKINFRIHSGNMQILLDNIDVKRLIKKKYKHIGTKGSNNLLRLILNGKSKIHIGTIKEKYVKFLQYNKSKFNDELYHKVDKLGELQLEIFTILNNYFGENVVEKYNEEKHGKLDKEIKDIDAVYIVKKDTSYKAVRELIANNTGDVIFKYMFNNADLKPETFQNVGMLQRIFIQITSKAVKFDYPVSYLYNCSKCGKQTTRLAKDVLSTKTKIECDGHFEYIDHTGESKTKMCWKILVPDDEMCEIKPCYYYDITYKTEDGINVTLSAYSFEYYEPGYFDVVGFKLKTPKKTEQFFIIDLKKPENVLFNLPVKTEENYLFTLQKAIDEFILQQTGVEIYGLNPIKCAMIIQALFASFGVTPKYNIQIAGEASTGKSTVLKYYGFLLYHHLNMSSNGLSISIPALRGTKTKIILLGNEQTLITHGYLGSYLAIHIDEANDNKELIENLKTFLHETNYGYDKAGATGIKHIRTAHINLSENLDYGHLGQYRGMIRKEYKNLNIRIGDDEKPKWDETWDLHQHLSYYSNNLYLLKVIKEKRQEFINNQVWWIDGYDYALHERFPFYFYLVNSEESKKELLNVVKRNISNDGIEENTQLMSVLKNKELNIFFKEIKEFRKRDSDSIKLNRVDEIVKEYDIFSDSRIMTFLYNLVKISRAINKREEIIEQDYDLLRWFLEKLNCKMAMHETMDYTIKGPPENKITINEIEDKTVEIKKEVDTNNLNFDNIDYSDLEGGAY